VAPLSRAPTGAAASRFRDDGRRRGRPTVGRRLRVASLALLLLEARSVEPRGGRPGLDFYTPDIRPRHARHGQKQDHRAGENAGHRMQVAPENTLARSTANRSTLARALISILDIARIFITAPSIVISRSSTMPATGDDADTRRSGVDASFSIPKYAPAERAPGGVARANGWSMRSDLSLYSWATTSWNPSEHVIATRMFRRTASP
jgi:hypothetical protein